MEMYVLEDFISGFLYESSTFEHKLLFLFVLHKYSLTEISSV